MATANIGKTKTDIDYGKDSIVVINCLGDIPGGRTLDVSGYDGDVIAAGHVIIRKSNGEYAPLGVSGNAYAALGTGDAFAGVLKHSVLKSDPRASIMTFGQINAAACPYTFTDAIKAGLSNIQFL